MKKWLKIFLPILLMGACAAPQTRIYSLYIPPAKQPAKQETINREVDASVVITVHSARHLTQPYIVSRKSPYQLEISRYSKWETSPSEKVSEVFKEALSSIQLFKEVRVGNIIPDGFYSLKINLKRFERFDEGNHSFSEFSFDATFISPDGHVIFRDTLSKKSGLGDRTFLNLAKGLSTDVTEGIEEVKNKISRSFKPSPS